MEKVKTKAAGPALWGGILDGTLYNGKAFFAQVKKKLAKTVIGSMCMVAIDIEHFRLFNKRRGRAIGDELLNAMKAALAPMGEAAGYMGGDNFALLMPRGRQYVEAVRERMLVVLGLYGASLGFTPLFGVYEIGEEEEDPALMYDRATLALSYMRQEGEGGMVIYKPSMEAELEAKVALLEKLRRGASVDKAS